MTASRILLIRHGRTAWNDARRIQGHRDIPLSPEGRTEVRGLRLPPRFKGFIWYTSPLIRAAETAALLGANHATHDVRLMEMNWGGWEGRTREEIARQLGDEMAVMEAHGRDFRPADGESPRELQARITSWLSDVGNDRRHAIAITHKGVIRACLGLACGWNLTGKAPLRLRWNRAHLFRFDPAGADLAVEQANISLAAPVAPVKRKIRPQAGSYGPGTAL